MQQGKYKDNKSCGEEIYLSEIFKSLWDYKFFIMLFSTTITFIVLIYLLSIPNVYSSKALFVPQDQKSGGLGGLAAVASFAGVSMGDGAMTPVQAYQSLLNNYAFMRKFVMGNNLTDPYLAKSYSKNYVFIFGFRGLFDLVHSSSQSNEDPDNDIYTIINYLKKNFSISSDKDSGLITIGFQDADRFLAEKILNLFLEQSSRYLIDNKLGTINRKMNYYQNELTKTESFELRKNISVLISKLVEEKITILSSQYYQAEILTKPEVAYIKNKVGPKRGLLLAITIFVSLIFGILIVFLRESFKNSAKNG